MARILIGNIKGPKGDTGPQGKQGPTGPQGPKGDTGPMPALINNAATTSAGVGALDAAMGKTLGDRIDVLNNKLINGSGLGLTEGMYSIYAPNTADDMVYPGLYRCNGITVGSMTDFYGYAIVMSSLDHTIIKQLIYHNASSQSLLRYRVNNQWTDAGEFALKDDLAERVRRYIDIENQEKFIGFVVNEYDPSILINPVSEYIRLQYKDIDTTYKIYDYGLWGNWENGKDIVSDLNIIKKKISFYAYGSETLNSPFKAGLTGEANSGIVISHFISDYYGCQLAISEEAYPSIFIRGYAEKWIEWKKVYPL